MAHVEDRTQGQLDYLKAQTWAISGYGIAMLAGIYGVSKTDDLLQWERWSLFAAAMLISILATVLLLLVQRDMRAVRLRLDPNDKEPGTRGWQFLTACIVAVVLTGSLACWFAVRKLFI